MYAGVAGLELKDLHCSVEEKLGVPRTKEIIQYLDFVDLTLWGTEKPSCFKEANYRLTIYKDLYAIGYGNLQKKIAEWLPLLNNLIWQNIQRIRGALRNWAETVLVQSSQRRVE